LKFARFDPEPCGFPKPRVPLLPNKAQLGLARSASSNTTKQFRHFTRGRYALGEAYRLAGVGREGALLAPAYHCVTMLDPALALDADVQLYPLQTDLSPDPGKLDELLSSYGKPVKALLAAHFFGVTQHFSWLKRWCVSHEITLIEDCSHTLFTERFQAEGSGNYGEFVVASPYKFFACADGGVLYTPEGRLLDDMKTRPASLTDELRGLKSLFESSRISVTTMDDIDAIDRQLLAFRAHAPITGNERIIERSQPSAQYSDELTMMASLRGSRFIAHHSSIKAAITRRKDNYRRWARSLENVPNCHASFPDLPEGCVPYMFPLYIDHPNPHFFWLKHLGVPIWRWDEMAISSCRIAQDYRLHLLHLPCHQALSGSQMDWMIAALQKTLHQESPWKTL
jgi:perosamine synthetase